MRISIKIGFLEDLANSQPDIGLECQKLLRLLQKTDVSKLQGQAPTFSGWRLYKLRYFPFILFSHPGNLAVLAKLEGNLVSIYHILILSDSRWQPLSAVKKAQHKAEEEAQKRIEEEQRRLEMERVQLNQEQRKVEEARQRVEETRRQLEEKARQLDQERRKVEEARCEVEEIRKQLKEEIQRKAEEEAQQRIEEEQKIEEKPEQLKGGRYTPLDHRPPRRYASTEEHPEKPVLREPGLRRPKPEIICLKRARQWILAVEIPVDLLENPGLTVLQNESPLPQDESDENYRCLKEFHGQVVIRWEEDGSTRERHTTFGEEGYLLFKLNNQNEGRYIRSPSFGSYLAVVPDSWERDFELSGPPPIAPEPVSLEGYQAHFYILEKGDGKKIAFRSQEGKSVIIQPRASRFELVGNLLNDANEAMGPLFGEKPPRIRSLDDRLQWKDIGTIVIGEEGIRKLGWTRLLSLDPDTQEQDLPSEVTERGDGWYFIRIYNLKDELLESLDFRFIPALKAIRVPPPSPVPTKDGHEPTRVEFLHQPGCTVQPSRQLEELVQIERGDNRTVLTLPANPNYDKTDWFISSRGTCQIQVTILVERLWWAIGEESQIPSEWKAQKLPLTREDFLATSRKTLWLRLPKPRWADKAFVGFKEATAVPCPIKVTERTISIPLRQFCDAQEIQNIGTILFNFWIHHRGTKYQITTCKLTLKANCRLCEFSISTEEDLWDHIKSDHLDACFRLLTSEETHERIQDQDSALPREIYKCSHCNFYVESDDPRNPTTVMDRHSKEKSHKAGAPLEIKILSKPDEIREVLSKNPPHLYECKWCRYLLRNAIPRDRIGHLRENHKNMLYVFQ
ncbi:MAG TPA: hypothetical protein VNM22_09345 [Candidatus Limnocylindrales bacterium]|nr:hypothetical protein [Candidatus Limnocylindrales bacterium]